MSSTTTIDLVASERPSGTAFMPHTPEIPASGVTACPPILYEKWLEYLEEFPNRKLFGAQKLKMYLEFLQHPTLLARTNNETSKVVLVGIKRCAPAGLKLEGNHQFIYRMPETASGRKFDLRYAPTVENAFRIIANVYCQLDHAGMAQTWSHVQSNYYGICESNVK